MTRTMTRILSLISILVAGTAGWLCWLWHNDPVPPLDPEEWWGASDLRGTNDDSIRPFRVEFSDEMIADLRRRLANFRAPPPTLEGMASEYGFNSHYLYHWRQYWADKYNFTERELFFNQFPQFKTKIQGLDIHFIRVRPEAPPGVEVVPLLVLHGWPGSVLEFYPLITLLTSRRPSRDFLFEVVAPSLPGFGFSDGSVRPGLGGPQAAIVLRNLMHRVGHKQFYVQAGDWGGEIATDLVTLYPEEVLGYHTNLPVAKHPCALALLALGAAFPSWMAELELAPRMNPFGFWLRETGYFYLQATKPDTISIALSESPVGLLAYILEKFSVATNSDYVHRPDGGLEEKFSMDQLLDNVMMYWQPSSSTTAARFYAEGFSEILRRWRLNVKPTPVPTWVLQARHEVLYQTPAALRFKFPNLLNVTVLHRGGHFIALEEPDLVAEDLIAAVKAFREFHARSRGRQIESS